MDKALTFSAEGPGFKSQPGQWNSFKKSKILFLIEDISELECLNTYTSESDLDLDIDLRG